MSNLGGIVLGGHVCESKFQQLKMKGSMVFFQYSHGEKHEDIGLPIWCAKLLKHNSTPPNYAIYLFPTLPASAKQCGHEDLWGTDVVLTKDTLMLKSVLCSLKIRE